MRKVTVSSQKLGRSIFERPISTNALEIIVLMLCAFFIGAMLSAALFSESERNIRKNNESGTVKISRSV